MASGAVDVQLEARNWPAEPKIEDPLREAAYLEEKRQGPSFELWRRQHAAKARHDEEKKPSADARQAHEIAQMRKKFLESTAKQREQQTKTKQQQLSGGVVRTVFEEPSRTGESLSPADRVTHLQSQVHQGASKRRHPGVSNGLTNACPPAKAPCVPQPVVSSPVVAQQIQNNPVDTQLDPSLYLGMSNAQFLREIFNGFDGARFGDSNVINQSDLDQILDQPNVGAQEFLLPMGASAQQLAAQPQASNRLSSAPRSLAPPQPNLQMRAPPAYEQVKRQNNNCSMQQPVSMPPTYHRPATNGMAPNVMVNNWNVQQRAQQRWQSSFDQSQLYSQQQQMAMLGQERQTLYAPAQSGVFNPAQHNMVYNMQQQQMNRMVASNQMPSLNRFTSPQSNALY